MFLSLAVLVSLDNATITVKNPDGALVAPAVIGKPSTPTPEGVYLLEKAYSTVMKENILIFTRDDNGVTAIHRNLESRDPYLVSKSDKDNRLSKGCVGVSPEVFDMLWNEKQPIVLQVY